VSLRVTDGEKRPHNDATWLVQLETILRHVADELPGGAGAPVRLKGKLRRAQGGAGGSPRSRP